MIASRYATRTSWVKELLGHVDFDTRECIARLLGITSCALPISASSDLIGELITSVDKSLKLRFVCQIILNLLRLYFYQHGIFVDLITVAVYLIWSKSNILQVWNPARSVMCCRICYCKLYVKITYGKFSILYYLLVAFIQANLNGYNFIKQMLHAKKLLHKACKCMTYFSFVLFITWQHCPWGSSLKYYFGRMLTTLSNPYLAVLYDKYYDNRN